jgi:hypothetical protein
VLNEHPEIACHGEVFHGRNVVHVRITHIPEGPEREALKLELCALRGRDPFAYLERVYALGAERPIVGFKIFERHNPNILEYLLGEASIRKVVLFRANGLARYASLRLAHETGQWGKTVTRPLVQFVEEDFLEQYDFYVSFIDQTIRTLISANQPFCVLRHDELNNAATIAGLVHFLGATRPMPSMSPKARIEGRGSPDIVARFSNPLEVEAFLRERGLMHWAYEGDTVLTTLTMHGAS